MAGYTIRAFAPADAEAIAALTLAAIRQTALRAYSPAQVAAWSARYSPARLRQSAARGDVILVAADALDYPAAYAVLVGNKWPAVIPIFVTPSGLTALFLTSSCQMGPEKFAAFTLELAFCRVGTNSGQCGPRGCRKGQPLGKQQRR